MHAYIWRYQNCSIHKRSVMDEKSCTVSFFRNKQSRTRLSEYGPCRNSLFFLPGGTEFDIHVPANVETVYFRFNQSSLLDKARAMPARPCPRTLPGSTTRRLGLLAAPRATRTTAHACKRQRKPCSTPSRTPETPRTGGRPLHQAPCSLTLETPAGAALS